MASEVPILLEQWRIVLDEAEKQRQAWAEADATECAIKQQTLDLARSQDTTTQESETPYNWRRWSACYGLDTKIFFPADGAGVEIAKKICERCVVRVECLEYALEKNVDHGVWGGASERERRRILRARRLSAKQSLQQ